MGIKIKLFQRFKTLSLTLQEINRVLYSFDGQGKEMPWADIVRFRNPSVNERAMIRARTRMQEEGQLFKRPVYGNTCVYSLTESQVKT